MNQEEEKIKKYLLPYQSILKLNKIGSYLDITPMINDDFIKELDEE